MLSSPCAKRQKCFGEELKVQGRGEGGSFQWEAVLVLYLSLKYICM